MGRYNIYAKRKDTNEEWTDWAITDKHYKADKHVAYCEECGYLSKLVVSDEVKALYAILGDELLGKEQTDAILDAGFLLSTTVAKQIISIIDHRTIREISNRKKAIADASKRKKGKMQAELEGFENALAFIKAKIRERYKVTGVTEVTEVTEETEETDDVVPRAEVEELQGVVDRYKVANRLLELDVADWRNQAKANVEEVYADFMRDYKCMEKELDGAYDELTELRKDYDLLCKENRTIRAAVAREIFAEIDQVAYKLMNSPYYSIGEAVYDLAELKKIYTGVTE